MGLEQKTNQEAMSEQLLNERTVFGLSKEDQKETLKLALNNLINL